MTRPCLAIALLLGVLGTGCADLEEEQAADLDEEQAADLHKEQAATEQLAIETCDVRVHSMDADLAVESLLHIVVPAANVEKYVPAPFQLLRLPAVAGGKDGALLWMLAGDITSIVTDGVERGPLLAAHLFVQIQEPAAPAGSPNTLGAVHLYELELLVNDNAVGDWFKKTLGGSTFTSRQMALTRIAPRLLPGVLELDVSGKPQYGQFTYYVEHTLLLPGPAPVVHGWFHGDEGLVRWDPTMTGELTPALDGEVCTDDQSRLREIFGARCLPGTGFVTSIHVDSTYNVWPCL